MKTKTAFLLYFTFCILHAAFPQAGEWVWLKGDTIANQPGNFGVQGVPSPSNNPPSLYEPCEWTDQDGNFWLFGGFGTDCQDNVWKYDPVTNEWTWIKGNGTTSQPAVYGTQGIPSPGNTPGNQHWCAATWADQQGDFWMFGGSDGGGGCYNILWKYDLNTNEWTWIKGSLSAGNTGYYGVQGISDPLNNPRARWETSATWMDDAGDLWLFGGLTNGGKLNDLWKYNTGSNEWTWMKGDSIINSSGNYGTIGVENSLNKPGARQAYSHWNSNNGFFWLFGGDYSVCFNDLWRYNLSSNNWTWMGGDSSDAGTYGIKCLASPANVPGARLENRSAWSDQKNNFWFFGGFTNIFLAKNDLWMYCLSLQQWIWMGSDSTNYSGYWGTMGVSNPANKPDGRGGAIGWSDNNGHFYLFGGTTAPIFSLHNDIWKYTIDTTCGVCPASTSIQEINNHSNDIEIFPNPAAEWFEVSGFPDFIGTGKFEVGDMELTITDMLGKELYRKKLQTSNLKLQTSFFPNGIYIVKVYTHEKVFQKKLIVNH